MPRVAKSKSASAKSEAGKVTPSVADKLKMAYFNTVELAEKKHSLSTGDMSAQRTPTNCLILDFYLRGGITSGMVSVSGQSQSAKSTLLLLLLGSSINAGVPLVHDYDAEGSVSADMGYACASMRQKDITDVLGQRRKKKWIKYPKMFYSRKNVIEDMFDNVVYTLNRIPDKVYNEERDQWFLKVPVKPKYKELENFKIGEPDKDMSDKKFLYYPSDNLPQGVIGVDSYPSFVPRDTDDKEEQSNQSAQQAAAYSAQIKRIVGKLSEKNVIWWGVNQLRKKVRTMGRENPWYRPCGEAIYFYANLLLDMRPISTPDKWQNSETKFKKTKFSNSYERSVEDPSKWDQYAYKELKVEKNKLGQAKQVMILRVHTRDHSGGGRGIDPVWDMFQFLETVGLATLKNKKGQKVLIFSNDCPGPLAGKVLSWVQFKTIVTADTYKEPSVFKKAVEAFKEIGVKPFSFKKWAYSLITSGKAAEIHAELDAGKSGSGSEELDLESED